MDVNFPIQLWDVFIPQIEMTLNMMRTLRQNPIILAYEDMEGVFDFDRTPLAILDIRGLAFLDPEEGASCQTHTVNVFYVENCPLHYRNLQFYDSASQNFRITATYKLYPTHCTMPTISEADHTIVAANELLTSLKVNVPTTAQTKCRHIKILDHLTRILQGTQILETDTSGPPRVDTTVPPRVANEATTLEDLTSPRVVKKTRHVHKRHTRQNTPMPTIMRQ